MLTISILHTSVRTVVMQNLLALYADKSGIAQVSVDHCMINGKIPSINCWKQQLERV
jgi:hypothetical protein